MIYSMRFAMCHNNICEAKLAYMSLGAEHCQAAPSKIENTETKNRDAYFQN